MSNMKRSAEKGLRESGLLGTWIVRSALEAAPPARAPCSTSDTKEPLTGPVTLGGNMQGK